jgi:predicted AlkP superfamily phosphohydrolase/phosphomutase
MITGLGTPSTNSEFTYPKELRSKLLNEFGYKMHVTKLNVTDREDIALADLYSTERKRKDVALQLMNTTDWDLFMVVFEGTDYIRSLFVISSSGFYLLRLFKTFL